MPAYDDYVPVEARLAEFWKAYPEGRVITRLVHQAHSPGQAFVVRALVFSDRHDAAPVATGFARQELLHEAPKSGSGKPNLFAPEWTSPLEVCETSAIGRALANIGLSPRRQPLPHASGEQLAEIGSILAAVDAETRAKIADWWKAKQFHPLASGFLTEIDANEILQHLSYLTKPFTKEDGE